ncbi:MAG: prepilin-type N-terminal cleavage/methylation domain-containing protein [Pelomonas sp.]|nr:prepilin-type N-terminal cleavage/methylation domain-containing protein [Roseateles sp.]
MTRTPERRPRGFTLVEVLVALFVMAIMAALAWRGLDGLVRSRAIAQLQVDRTARLQAVLQQFEQDLLAVQDSGAADAIAFDGANLRLTRRQPGGLQAVAWTVRDGRLYRWAGPVVQQVGALVAAAQNSVQFAPDDSQRVSALDGVADWQMYFYRGNAWTNAQSSADLVASSSGGTSDRTNANTLVSSATGSAGSTGGQSGLLGSRPALPTGVRVVLSFAPGSGFSGTLSKDVVMEKQQ